ncbi:hypothetical protein LCGC14_2372890, partial [marine sediment metagenome]
MKKYEFVDLGINSTKFPFNTHLWWEHSTYGIVMVDGTDQTVLLHSTKARLLIDGSDWSVVNLTDNTNSYKIQSGWLDGNDLWLVMCDNDGTADDFEVCFIELDDSNDCNPVGVSVGADINTVYAHDIFKAGANIYVMNKEARDGTIKVVVWDVDTAPFVEKDTQQYAGIGTLGDISYGVVVPTGGGSGAYWYVDGEAANKISLIHYSDTGGNLDGGGDSLAGASFTGNKSQSSLSYDGSDYIYFVYKKDSDGLIYLYAWSYLLDQYTELGRFDIALMLDRNNNGFTPTEIEKGFGISDEKVYEITPRRAKLTLFQNMGSLLTTNIIGITDNYLIAADTGGGAYPMFELQDVSGDEISECIIDYLMGNVTTCEF